MGNMSYLHHRRWIFYLATIIVAVTGMLMCFIRESHASQLLERKVAAIQSLRADLMLRTAPTAPRPSIFQPLILLFTKPTIFLSSLANAFSTALLYLFAVAFPLIYAHYAWSRRKATLLFLFIALGLLFSTLTRFHDRHATRKSRRANRRLPEQALFGFAIGAPVLAVGLWWFAWTVPGTHVKGVAWSASALSLTFIGYGVNEHSTVLPRHVLASNKRNKPDAASAFTALLLVRALLSALFPLFTRQMFENLGTNPAASVLAAIPTILVKFGARVRGSGPCGGGGGEESGGELEVEKRAGPKPKKTVRWGDGTDGSRARSEDRSDSESAGSCGILRTERKSEGDGADTFDLSRLETDVETRDFVSTEISRGDAEESEREQGPESVEVARTETKYSGSRSSGSADRNKKEKEKGMTRGDWEDDGAAGYLGMDVERLAVFPYL